MRERGEGERETDLHTGSKSHFELKEGFSFTFIRLRQIPLRSLRALGCINVFSVFTILFWKLLLVIAAMSGNGETNGQPTAFKFGGFKFAKSAKPKSAILQIENKFQAESATENNDNNVDFITVIDDKQIKGTKPESSKTGELIIPFIAVNKYKIAKTKTENTTDTTTSTTETSTAESDTAGDLISKAKRELIQDAKKYENDQDDAIPAWKLMVINKAPAEYENDSKLDVSIRPSEPTLDDYESVPVEAFGSALLRGMGWKAGDPIGGINKAITPIFEPHIRARGLGLGADASLQKQLLSSEKDKRKHSNDGFGLKKQSVDEEKKSAPPTKESVAKNGGHHLDTKSSRSSKHSSHSRERRHHSRSRSPSRKTRDHVSRSDYPKDRDSTHSRHRPVSPNSRKSPVERYNRRRSRSPPSRRHRSPDIHHRHSDSRSLSRGASSHSSKRHSPTY